MADPPIPLQRDLSDSSRRRHLPAGRSRPPTPPGRSPARGATARSGSSHGSASHPDWHPRDFHARAYGNHRSTGDWKTRTRSNHARVRHLHTRAPGNRRHPPELHACAHGNCRRSSDFHARTHGNRGRVRSSHACTGDGNWRRPRETCRDTAAHAPSDATVAPITALRMHLCLFRPCSGPAPLEPGSPVQPACPGHMERARWPFAGWRPICSGRRGHDPGAASAASDRRISAPGRGSAPEPHRAGYLFGR